MKTLSLSIAVVILSLVLAVSTYAVTFNGCEYQVIFNPMISWSDAKDAVPDGWHLATVTNQAENNFIQGLIQSVSHMGQYWLGGHWTDIWKWVDNEPWSYTNFYSGHQNPVVESYLNIEVVTGYWAEFNDSDCNNYVAGYVMEAVPEPATLILLGVGLTGLATLGRKKLKKKKMTT